MIWQCAGDGARWGNWGGTPKQLCTPVPGAPVSLLTWSVFRAVTYAPASATHWILTEDPSIRAWLSQWVGAPVRLLEPGPRLGSDADKLWTTAPHWSTGARTWVLMGDVWLSSAAAQTMMGGGQPPCVWYGRRCSSQLTGKPWREMFGLSFMPSEQHGLLRACRAIHEARHAASRGLWGIQGAQTDQNPADRPLALAPFCEVDDWTEDFDFPGDLLRWQRERFGFTVEDTRGG